MYLKNTLTFFEKPLTRYFLNCIMGLWQSEFVSRKCIFIFSFNFLLLPAYFVPMGKLRMVFLDSLTSSSWK